MEGKIIDKFLEKDNVFAVVGASRDPNKYGNEVYKDLREGGYKVYPVNPNADYVLSDKSYSSLKVLPEKPDVVDVVVPPEVTAKIVKQCSLLDIDKVWLQPGSETDEIIKYCKDNDIEVIHGVCVMKERIKKG